MVMFNWYPHVRCNVKWNAILVHDNKFVRLVISVRLHGTTRLPQNGVSWNLVAFFENQRRRFNLTRIADILHKYQYTLMLISRWILLEWEMFQRKGCRENQDTHFMFKNVFHKTCRLWDNVEKYGRSRQARDDNTILCMGIACWIPTATNTHFEYVILIALLL